MLVRVRPWQLWMRSSGSRALRKGLVWPLASSFTFLLVVFVTDLSSPAFVEMGLACLNGHAAKRVLVPLWQGAAQAAVSVLAFYCWSCVATAGQADLVRAHLYDALCSCATAGVVHNLLARCDLVATCALDV
ncbi:hypothetical protein COO60DRAFT_1482843 [Scenedesmus sp. NREL 46B-D3]|nr:hypothetical protein COO60DRAFT_1482843 [Scenedesmus sp. NREL 46B-D3]